MKTLSNLKYYLIGLGVLALALGLVFSWGPRAILAPEYLVESPQAENEQTVEEYPPLKILFGGDIFLDRSIRIQKQRHGIDYPWEHITEFLNLFEYKIANLEGPVMNRPHPSGTAGISIFNFAFQEEYVANLTKLGFTALSLANNHTVDQGQAVLDHTRNFLNEVGIDYFGDPNNRIDYCCTYYVYEDGQLINTDGSRIDYLPAGRQTDDSRMIIALVGEHNLYTGDPPQILTKIGELKEQGYFVIVMPHWGPEYVLDIPAIQQRRAYALIEAGADLIMGAHPHVVQPIEIYQGKVIFYSLGNFLFDQYFSTPTMRGLLVEVVFEAEGLRFVLHPTEQNRTFQILPASLETRTEKFERLANTSPVSEEIKEGIRQGEFFVEYEKK